MPLVQLLSETPPLIHLASADNPEDDVIVRVHRNSFQLEDSFPCSLNELSCSKRIKSFPCLLNTLIVRYATLRQRVPH